jgi:peptidyl-prolyl cis-trans isomerase C
VGSFLAVLLAVALLVAVSCGKGEAPSGTPTQAGGKASAEAAGAQGSDPSKPAVTPEKAAGTAQPAAAGAAAAGSAETAGSAAEKAAEGPAGASPDPGKDEAAGKAGQPGPNGPSGTPESERERATRQLASEHAPAPGEPVVAWTEGRKVYRPDFESYLGRLPVFQKRELASLEKKRELLLNYIKFDTLADLAKKEGLDQDPDVLLAARTEMVKKYIQKKFGEDAKIDVAEDEIKAHYERDGLMYNKPERVRVSHILLPDRVQAEKVLQELKGVLASPDSSTRQAFREFVRKYSTDEATNSRGGDLLFFSREGQVDGSEVKVDPAVVSAAFAMQNIDQVSDVVEGKDGFHILMLMNRREKVEKPLDSVREDIRQNIAREKLDVMRREFMDKLVDFSVWQVEVVELNKVVVEDVPPSPAAVKERVDSIQSKGKEESAPPKAE